MKISEDQNRIDLGNGLILVSVGIGHCRETSRRCNDCDFMAMNIRCSRIPCGGISRADGRDKIFIREKSNANDQ